MTVDCTVLFDLLKLVVNRSDERIKRLADSVFEIYLDNIGTISSSDLKYCELYVTLIKEIIANQINISDHKIDITNIFKRHLTNQVFRRDTYVTEALKSVLDVVIPPTRLADITKRLNTLVAWYVSKRYITKLYGHLKESNLSYSIDDQAESLDNVRNLLNEFRLDLSESSGTSSKNGPVEVIDLSNKTNIREAYKLFKERRVTNVLKTGLQGINQMFGPAGGIALGESVLFAARTHHYKSGMLMKMAQWIPKYSTLPKTPGKKPMILIVTLENEGYQNMLKIFKELYVACKGSMPPSTMSDEEMVEIIYEYFNQSECTLVIERYLPSYFGYNEFTALVEKYENAGFRIIAAIVDYMGQMKTHDNGSAASRSGDHALLQELYNNMVNYCKAVGSSLISAHQLNRGASDIAASGIPHPVKHYSERHFAGSTGIAREIDFLAYLEIEKDEQGNSWLTVNWGKHRYVDSTPEIHKFVCYPFTPNGILDDVDGEFTGSRNLYKKKDSKKATDSDIEAILGGI